VPPCVQVDQRSQDLCACHTAQAFAALQTGRMELNNASLSCSRQIHQRQQDAANLRVTGGSVRGRPAVRPMLDGGRNCAQVMSGTPPWAEMGRRLSGCLAGWLTERTPPRASLNAFAADMRRARYEADCVLAFRCAPGWLARADSPGARGRRVAWATRGAAALWVWGHLHG
jgi:hypothetical protein